MIPTLASCVMRNTSLLSGINLNIPLVPVSNISAVEFPCDILFALNQLNPEPSPLKEVAVTIPEKVAFPLAEMVAAVPTLIFPLESIFNLEVSFVAS